MYIPGHFSESDQDRLSNLITDYPFGMLVTSEDGRPYSSHLPIVMEGDTLLCHLARANPQCEHLRSQKEVLCIFHGPHSYVSPSWYSAPGVPTWNYAAVHVYGKPSLIDDPDELSALVDGLTERFESNQPSAWLPDYNRGKLAAIVGVRITDLRIEGKFKLSQNRSADDRRNVIEQLELSGTDHSLAMATLMRENEPRKDS